MMRIVFLLYAEERGLLPRDEGTYRESYGVSSLVDQLRDEADRVGEEVLERRYVAWARLLAVFRAIHGGVSHEEMRLPAYGGSLFDPDRYPFLEGRGKGTGWSDTIAPTLPINDRTILHVLESIQFLRTKSGGSLERRRLSYKELGVEQIGHVYESLLDHTAVRATSLVLGLEGGKGLEPELEVPELERRRSAEGDGFVQYLVRETGRSEGAVKRGLEYDLSEQEHAWLVACDNDQDLLERVRPYAGLVRSDPSGYPVVIPDGAVYVTGGPDRRSSGTHYTPPSFTEPVVRHALDPLVFRGPVEGRPQEEWTLKSPREILELKVCDMAMGSAAFLVQTTRYLADRLLEAWGELEEANPGRILVTPEGGLSTGSPAERPFPKDVEERLAIARRVVVDRCVFGVDRDPMAVEMAKLSLWLLTLEKGKPFSFLDHSLKCGDSLLGVTDIEQVSGFDLDTSQAQFSLFRDQAQSALRRAVTARRELEAFQVLDIRDAEKKARLLEKADVALTDLKLVGDALVATAIQRQAGAASDPDADPFTVATQLTSLLETQGTGEGESEARREFDAKVQAWLDTENPDPFHPRRPFHWLLEFPEVFFPGENEKGGFDAILGNPPFLHGQKITGLLGTIYREFIVKLIAGGKRGSADLCSYFFLRCDDLLRPGGTLGLLATNTIAQGDTREVGLGPMLGAGFSILRAIPTAKWPGTANLEVAKVWMRKGEWPARADLDGKSVDAIDSYLTGPDQVTGDPHKLETNLDLGFQGTIVLGAGFVLTNERAAALIEVEEKSEDVIFPYMTGKDLNSRSDQTPSRSVINFFDWPREEAERYEKPFRIVEDLVKPERAKVKRKVRREQWWLFAERASGLYHAIGRGHSFQKHPKGWHPNKPPLEKVIAIATGATKYVHFGMIRADIIFANTLAIIASDDYGLFAALNSGLHEHWAWTYCSTMRRDLRYTITDGFETYPFPEDLHGLWAIGERYDRVRSELMLALDEGMTKVYNRLHDPTRQEPEIIEFRALQRELDLAVVGAYGWDDLSPKHDHVETTEGPRYRMDDATRRELGARLLALNHQRHAQEGS